MANVNVKATIDWEAWCEEDHVFMIGVMYGEDIDGTFENFNMQYSKFFNDHIYAPGQTRQDLIELTMPEGTYDALVFIAEALPLPPPYTIWDFEIYKNLIFKIPIGANILNATFSI